jgi:adenylate kinase family enzyme
MRTAAMRVLVFGNSGSGKSRFTHHLAAKHGLRVLDLDTIVWSQTEYAVFRPDADIIRDLSQFVQSAEPWVVEGCYGRWMEHLRPHCTEMVFMNPGEAVCLRNCIARPWEGHKYGTKREQDAKLPLLLDWVRAYYSRSDDMSLRAHRRLFDSFDGRKREITANEPDA